MGLHGGGGGGVYLVGCTPPLPPWTEFLTHACENITFPQLLLRMVKMIFLIAITISVNNHPLG